MHDSPLPDAPTWPLLCLSCRAGLPHDAWISGARCGHCGADWPVIDGVWQGLSPERAANYAGFLHDYLEIRREEGRAGNDARFYHDLPKVPDTDPLAGQWHIRARSYRAFVDKVLPGRGRALRVVDCGAGCGWLSHRLRELGHHPCSVDVNDDPEDGLRAARHYAPNWPVIRAEFDALPLGDACADLVVYNAAFQYSANYERTLREALRVLRPGGVIVVLDSPLYYRPESGPAMVAERHANYTRRTGRAFSSVGGIEHLGLDLLPPLEAALGLRFRLLPVWYGWSWCFSHWKARLQGKRERATFAVVVAERV